jgi:hypothetical protein
MEAALDGFTEIVEMRLVWSQPAAHLDLELTLRTSEHSTPGATRTLHAVDVSGLALREFGGGMTQLMRIEVLDRSEEQLDRVSFEFVEREYQLLRFVCANASVE